MKGYVTINPRWAGFKARDYYQAATSIVPSEEQDDEGFESEEPQVQITVGAGDFDLRGFELTRSEYFDSHKRAYVLFQDNKIKFSTACIRKLGKYNRVEFLINPIEGLFAVRTAADDNRNAVVCSKLSNGVYFPKEIACSAFMQTLFELFGWKEGFKYRITGRLFQKGNESVFIFDTNDAEAFIQSYLIPRYSDGEGQDASVKPLSVSGKRIRAVPETWINSFGNEYYIRQNDAISVETQNAADWQIRLDGQLYESGEKLHVTQFDELKQYIEQELGCKPQLEANNE